MADNATFDQLKFYLGLGVFIYAVWSLYGTKLGIGEPPDFSLGGGGAPPAAAPEELKRILVYIGDAHGATPRYLGVQQTLERIIQ